jgi:hypothetical protein
MSVGNRTCPAGVAKTALAREALQSSWNTWPQPFCDCRGGRERRQHHPGMSQRQVTCPLTACCSIVSPDWGGGGGTNTRFMSTRLYLNIAVSGGVAAATSEAAIPQEINARKRTEGHRRAAEHARWNNLDLQGVGIVDRWRDTRGDRHRCENSHHRAHGQSWLELQNPRRMESLISSTAFRPSLVLICQRRAGEVASSVSSVGDVLYGAEMPNRKPGAPALHDCSRHRVDQPSAIIQAWLSSE